MLLNFSTGSCEEWLRFCESMLLEVLAGQNITTGPASCSVAHRLLEGGDALRTFYNAATAAGNTTVYQFAAYLSAAAHQVLWAQAAQLQNQFIRRVARKPASVKTHEHMPHRQAEQLRLIFPPLTVGGANPTKLSNDEIMDVLEFGAPNSGQKAMVAQDFLSTNHLVAKFVALWERVGQIEKLTAAGTARTHTTTNNTTTNNNNNNNVRNKNNVGEKKESKSKKQDSRKCHGDGD
jgi:hypothetical protein